jgi:hypothetical protein
MFPKLLPRGYRQKITRRRVALQPLPLRRFPLRTYPPRGHQSTQGLQHSPTSADLRPLPYLDATREFARPVLNAASGSSSRVGCVPTCPEDPKRVSQEREDPPPSICGRDARWGRQWRRRSTPLTCSVVEICTRRRYLGASRATGR